MLQYIQTLETDQQTTKLSLTNLEQAVSGLDTKVLALEETANKLKSAAYVDIATTLSSGTDTVPNSKLLYNVSVVANNALPTSGGEMTGDINMYEDEGSCPSLVFPMAYYNATEYCRVTAKSLIYNSVLYPMLLLTTFGPYDEYSTIGHENNYWGIAYIDALYLNRIASTITPTRSLSYDLGSSDYVFSNIYVNSLKSVSEIIIPQEYTSTSYTYSQDLYITSGQVTSSYYSVATLLMSTVCPYEDGASLGLSNRYWHAAYIDTLYTNGCATLSPITDGYYSIGTSSCKWGNGYFTNIYTDYVDSDLIPKTTNTYSLGSIDCRYKYMYLQYFTFASSSILPSIHANGSIGSQTLAFYTSYMSCAYRFGTGSTWWNGMSYSESIYVHYGSSTTTTSDNGITLGESGIVCKVACDCVDFAGSNSVTSNAGFATYSDPKVKKFTDDIDIDSSDVCKLFNLLQVRSYKYRANPNTVQIGINAEEFENAMNEIGLDAEKYGICTISYNHYLSRGNDREDDKFYCKFAVISYEKLTTLSIKKIQDMEQTTRVRLSELEERIIKLEQKG